MKKQQVKWLLAAALLVSTNVFMSCCGDDPDPVIDNGRSNSGQGGGGSSGQSQSLKDNDAGTFIITNISTNEELQGSSHQCFVGDTLKVEFKPKDLFSSLKFNITADNFTKLNDSLFRVSDLGTSLGGGISMAKNVKFKASNQDNGNSLSAEKTVPFFTFVAEADVRYNLSVSPDLLQFVSVTLEYTTDSDGLHTKQLSDDDWIRDTIYSYVFTNDDGGVIRSNHKDDHEGYTLTDSIPHYYTDFVLDMHYAELDTDHTVTARYTPKNAVEPTKETYTLRHSLTWGAATIAGANITNISIGIGGKTEYQRDEVESYVNELSTTPDVISLHLNKRERKITKKN